MSREKYKRLFAEAIDGKESLLDSLERLTEDHIESVGIPLRPIYDGSEREINEDGYLIPSDVVDDGTPQDIARDSILRDLRGHVVLLSNIVNRGMKFDDVFDSWGGIEQGSTILEILIRDHPMPSVAQITMAAIRLADSRQDFPDIDKLPGKIREMDGAMALIKKLHDIGQQLGPHAGPSTHL